jgi:hypothetical protein
MNIQQGGLQQYNSLLQGNQMQAQAGIGAANAQTNAAAGAARYGVAPNAGWASMLNGFTGSSGNVGGALSGIPGIGNFLQQGWKSAFGNSGGGSDNNGNVGGSDNNINVGGGIDLSNYTGSPSPVASSDMFGMDISGY